MPCAPSKRRSRSTPTPRRRPRWMRDPARPPRKSMINNIWQAHNLKPHRVETFKLSSDPKFLEVLHRRRDRGYGRDQLTGCDLVSWALRQAIIYNLYGTVKNSHDEKQPLFLEHCIMDGFRNSRDMQFGVRAGASGAREIDRRHLHSGELDRYDAGRGCARKGQPVR